MCSSNFLWWTKIYQDVVYHGIVQYVIMCSLSWYCMLSCHHDIVCTWVIILQSFLIWKMTSRSIQPGLFPLDLFDQILITFVNGPQIIFPYSGVGLTIPLYETTEYLEIQINESLIGKPKECPHIVCFYRCMAMKLELIVNYHT